MVRHTDLACSPTRAATSIRHLGVLLAAALAPILIGIALRSTWPVHLVALGAPVAAAAVAWRRGARLSRRETALLAVAALACLPSGPLFGAWTFLGGAGAVLLLRSRGLGLSWWVRRRWWVTALAVAAAGGVLAGINVASARASGVAPEVGGPVLGLLGTARAGLSEEIGMRLFLLACALVVLGRRPSTRGQEVLTYLVLVVPHAAMHFQSFEGLVAGTIALAAVFGMPLAWLMKRFGVLAAVVAHTLIDAVRFLALGG